MPEDAPETGGAPIRHRRIGGLVGSSWRLKAAGAGLLVVALGGVALGTWSTFSTTRNKSQDVSTGTFVFNLADPAAGSPFSTAITGLAPGDMGDRLVTLTNGGSIAFGAVTVAATAPTSSVLDTDATNGLQLQVDACSVPWTQASQTVAATCTGGTITPLTPSTAVSTLKAAGPSYTAGLNSLTPGGVDHLRFHYLLPGASTGTDGRSSTLSYAFTATQAAGGVYR